MTDAAFEHVLPPVADAAGLCPVCGSVVYTCAGCGVVGCADPQCRRAGDVVWRPGPDRVVRCLECARFIAEQMP